MNANVTASEKPAACRTRRTPRSRAMRASGGACGEVERREGRRAADRSRSAGRPPRSDRSRATRRRGTAARIRVQHAAAGSEAVDAEPEPASGCASRRRPGTSMPSRRGSDAARSTTRAAGARRRVAVDEPPDRRRPAPICAQQRRGAGDAGRRAPRCRPPRSKRIEASVLRPSRLLVRRTEAGRKQALSSAMRVVPGPTSDARPPITPPTAAARAASAITSMSGSSARSTPSSVVSRSPASARRITSTPTLQAAEVERVHGLAQLQHDVVGDVHDVADRPDARSLEPLDEPPWRRAHRDLEDLRAVSRAEGVLLQPDVEQVGTRGRQRPWILRREPRRKAERPSPDGRRLTRDADMAQAIRAIRGDLEIDHRHRTHVDRGHLETAQCDLPRDLLHVGGNVHHLGQPRMDDFHGGNCSRKRRSFS